MEKVDGYSITEKEFKQLNKCVENIYNTVVVVDYFLDYSGRSVLHFVSKNLTIFIHFIELSLLRVSQLRCSLYRKSAFMQISRRLKNYTIFHQ